MAVTMEPLSSEPAISAKSALHISAGEEKRLMDTGSIEITLVWKRILVYWIGVVIAS